MILTLHGTPSEKQREFFRAKARHIAYGGARGGGKSWAMRRKLIVLCLKYRGLNCLLMRRTLPELRENHLLPLMRELSPVCTYKATERVILFPTGSRIKLGYCDNDKDIYQYQGQEYDVVALEEATHFSEEQMRFITTCNRSVRGDFSPVMYYTCNPGNVGHAWVKRLFIDKETENPEDYVFIPAKVFDNKVLMEKNPEYVKTLSELPEDLKRAHLYGDWDVFSGQYFREFRRDIHVIEPHPLPKNAMRFASMDWGYNDPCCVLWHAVLDNGDIVTYRELYVRETPAPVLAERIKELSRGENIRYIAASPDMWQNRGLGAIREGISLAEVFAKHGVFLTPADNSRVAGWQSVRNRLKNEKGVATWRAFSTCLHLIKELPALVYDTKNVEDAKDGNDHAPEALRYALFTHPAMPHKSVIPKEAAYNPLDTAGRDEGFLEL